MVPTKNGDVLVVSSLNKIRKQGSGSKRGLPDVEHGQLVEPSEWDGGQAQAHHALEIYSL